MLFNQYTYVCVCILSHVWLLWPTVAHQAPLSMEFFSKTTGTGCHFLLQGIFLTQGTNQGLINIWHFIYINSVHTWLLLTRHWGSELCIYWYKHSGLFIWSAICHSAWILRWIFSYFNVSNSGCLWHLMAGHGLIDLFYLSQRCIL